MKDFFLNYYSFVLSKMCVFYSRNHYRYLKGLYFVDKVETAEFETE